MSQQAGDSIPITKENENGHPINFPATKSDDEEGWLSL